MLLQYNSKEKKFRKYIQLIECSLLHSDWELNQRIQHIQKALYCTIFGQIHLSQRGLTYSLTYHCYCDFWMLFLSIFPFCWPLKPERHEANKCKNQISWKVLTYSWSMWRSLRFPSTSTIRGKLEMNLHKCFFNCYKLHKNAQGNCICVFRKLSIEAIKWQWVIISEFGWNLFRF